MEFDRLFKRFWRCVDRSGGPNACWLWTGSTTGGGNGDYGTLQVNGKPHYAHRLSYRFHVGYIPDGLCVLHACDTPSCVNPAHLSVGTRKENTQDAVRKGRLAHGNRHPGAKLTDAKVREIRERRAAGERQPALAREFGVSQVSVSLICANKTWRHVA
jgi:hypothetical protein